MRKYPTEHTVTKIIRFYKLQTYIDQNIKTFYTHLTHFKLMINTKQIYYYPFYYLNLDLVDKTLIKHRGSFPVILQLGAAYVYRMIPNVYYYQFIDSKQRKMYDMKSFFI